MMDECVICCTDRPPLHRICKCNTVIHEACINEVVNKVPSHRRGCPICKQPYEFHTTTTLRHKLNVSWMIFSFAGSGTILVPLIANVLCCRSKSVMCAIFHSAMTVMTLCAFLSFSYMWISYFRESRRVCPCVDTLRSQDARLKMPPPHELSLA